MASSLKNFIHSLNPKSLPRILQIQSGFYEEGSVHEKFDHECCLSTGDVIKIVGLKVKKLIASNCESDDSPCSTTVELPLDFPGLCNVVTDKTPFTSTEEIVRKVLIGSTQLQHPCFYCSEDLNIGEVTIKQGEKITFRSVEEENGIIIVNAGVTRNDQSCAIALPLSQEGAFYEWQDDYTYTLKEIAEWKIAKGRKRSVIFTNVCTTEDLFPLDFEHCVTLFPVYEVQAVMKFQKEIVHFHSDLDVEVKDVTGSYNINSFLQPLSMEDILKKTSNEFPMVVAVIEESTGNKQSYNLLCPGREVIIYKKHRATRILASEIKKAFYKRHFLIPANYKGKFKRQPREFPTAYDLEIARSVKEQLHVTATKAFVSPQENLCSVSIGDQFLISQRNTSEVVDQGKKEVENVLVCEKILLLDKTYKNVLLPMCMEGGFVEIVHDHNQYEISELCKDFHLPFNVKVSKRDLSIQDDILVDIPCLQLEEEITDAFLLISSLNNPTEVWEVPVHRLNMSFQLVRKHVEEIVCFPTKSIVEEITEEQYCMMRRYESQATTPPPRPPKTHKAEESKTTFLTVPVQSACGSPKTMKSPDQSPALDVDALEPCPKEKLENPYVDVAKKHLSNQVAAVLGSQLSCQSDLECPENVAGRATLEECRVNKARTTLVKYRTEKQPKAKSDLDSEIGSITKKFQESTVDNKAILLKKDKNESSE